MLNVLRMVIDATLVGISTGRLYQSFLGFLALAEPEGARQRFPSRTLNPHPTVG